MRIQDCCPLIVVAALTLLPGAAAATPAEPAEPATRQAVGGRALDALARAWAGDLLTPAVGPLSAASPANTALAAAQRRRAPVRPAAGPNIGTVGIGGIGGLSDFEIGPSFRLWATERVGFQAHLGFSGDELGSEHVDFIRFEPTVIVAIGDFGDGSVNVRPYAGGGLRVIRSDIGSFNDSQIKPVAVGGVEFGFRRVPRFKVSAELSVAPDADLDDLDLRGRGPKLTGARVSALGHYFF